MTFTSTVLTLCALFFIVEPLLFGALVLLTILLVNPYAALFASPFVALAAFKMEKVKNDFLATRASLPKVAAHTDASELPIQGTQTKARVVEDQPPKAQAKEDAHDWVPYKSKAANQMALDLEPCPFL